MKKRLIIGETICGVGIIVFASIFYICSYNAPEEAMAWPRIALAVTFVLTILMMYLAYIGKGLARPEKFIWGGPTFLMMISSLVYIILLNFIGFLILTPVWCFYVFKTMGYRNKMVNSIVSLVLTVVIFYIFKKLLYVPVPLGPLSSLLI